MRAAVAIGEGRSEDAKAEMARFAQSTRDDAAKVKSAVVDRTRAMARMMAGRR